MGQNNSKKDKSQINQSNINQLKINKLNTNQLNINQLDINQSNKNQLKINQTINQSNINQLNINQLDINQLKNNYLQYISSIKAHKDWIKSVKILPSGDIISVSGDKSIKIFDGLNYKIIQNIENAHKNDIINLFIKDENNFATCSEDKCINIWIKKENEFILNRSIINAHNERITNLIYLSNDNIISCSNDSTIKIWELHNNKYQSLTFIKINYNNFDNYINSLLLLEDKNILVSSGYNGTIIWKIYEKGMNIEFIYCFKEAFGGCWNGLKRIDDDRIIVGGEKSLKVISIKEIKIIKSIEIPFRCNGIITIEEKGIFLMGGWSKDILIFRNDNYECLCRIYNAHNEYIVGLCELKNGLILSFSGDTTMKIWSLNIT